MATFQGQNRYMMGRHLGSGVYGDVFHAYDLVTRKFVAVKILKPKELAPEYMVFDPALRKAILWEIHVLCRFPHPNIVKLLDAFIEEHMFHLVFELMDTDLLGLIKDQPKPLRPADIKSYMQMFLQGLAHLHQNSILHRDVKPDNLLIGPDGVLKLADLGLSVPYNPNVEANTSKVFAREYRAPELLRGATWYGPEVDIWAAGCVFAELILGHMLFAGKDEVEIHQKIYKTFLAPSRLGPLDLEYCSIETMKKVFPGTSDDCLDLLRRMFDDLPERRITAQQALNHRYFTSGPMPTPAHLLPRKASPEIDFELHVKILRRTEVELQLDSVISPSIEFRSSLHQTPPRPYVYHAPPPPLVYPAPPTPIGYRIQPTPDAILVYWSSWFQRLENSYGYQAQPTQAEKSGDWSLWFQEIKNSPSNGVLEFETSCQRDRDIPTDYTYFETEEFLAQRLT